jgi:hypothetical protein
MYFFLLLNTVGYMISLRGGEKEMQAGVAFVARLIFIIK